NDRRQGRTRAPGGRGLPDGPEDLDHPEPGPQPDQERTELRPNRDQPAPRLRHLPKGRDGGCPAAAAGRPEDPHRGSRPRLQEAKTRRAGTRPSAGRGGHVMSPNPRERVVDTNSPSDSLPTPFQLPCFQVPPVPIGSWKPTSNSLLGPGDRSRRSWTWDSLEGPGS